jgi:ABC-2 type transport system permease protein
MALIGIFFYVMNLDAQNANFGATLYNGAYFLIIFAPIITMKLLAEEKKNRSDILLLTSPTPISKIIIGKYLSAVAVFVIMVLLTFIFPLIMVSMTEKPELLPWASMIGNYVGFVMMGILFLSVGLLASSLSDSQVLSAVVGIVSLLILWFTGQIGVVTGGWIGKVATWISPIVRNESFSRGLLSIADIVFYITFTAVVLFITIVNTERKRWSQG